MIVSFHCKCQSFNLHATYQVSGGHDRVIHVWDVETSTHLHTFTGHRDSISVGNMSETVLIMRGGGREEGGREEGREGGRKEGREGREGEGGGGREGEGGKGRKGEGGREGGGGREGYLHWTLRLHLGRQHV